MASAPGHTEPSTGAPGAGPHDAGVPERPAGRAGASPLPRSLGAANASARRVGSALQRPGRLASTTRMLARQLGLGLGSREAARAVSTRSMHVRFPEGVWAMAQQADDSNRLGTAGLDPSFAAIVARYQSKNQPKAAPPARRGLPYALRRRHVTGTGVGTGPTAVATRTRPSDVRVPRNDGHGPDSFAPRPRSPRPKQRPSSFDEPGPPAGPSPQAGVATPHTASTAGLDVRDSERDARTGVGRAAPVRAESTRRMRGQSRATLGAARLRPTARPLARAAGLASAMSSASATVLTAMPRSLTARPAAAAEKRDRLARKPSQAARRSGRALATTTRTAQATSGSMGARAGRAPAGATSRDNDSARRDAPRSAPPPGSSAGTWAARLAAVFGSPGAAASSSDVVGDPGPTARSDAPSDGARRSAWPVTAAVPASSGAADVARVSERFDVADRDAAHDGATNVTGTPQRPLAAPRQRADAMWRSTTAGALVRPPTSVPAHSTITPVEARLLPADPTPASAPTRTSARTPAAARSTAARSTARRSTAPGSTASRSTESDPQDPRSTAFRLIASDTNASHPSSARRSSSAAGVPDTAVGWTADAVRPSVTGAARLARVGSGRRQAAPHATRQRLSGTDTHASGRELSFATRALSRAHHGLFAAATRPVEPSSDLRSAAAGTSAVRPGALLQHVGSEPAPVVAPPAPSRGTGEARGASSWGAERSAPPRPTEPSRPPAAFAPRWDRRLAMARAAGADIPPSGPSAAPREWATTGRPATNGDAHDTPVRRQPMGPTSATPPGRSVGAPLPLAYRGLAAALGNRHPVRVLHDAGAREALRRAGVPAATVGSTILLDRAPSLTPAMREHIGHELVHTAAGGATPRLFGDPRHDGEEHAARRVGRLARQLAPIGIDGAALTAVPRSTPGPIGTRDLAVTAPARPSALAGPVSHGGPPVPRLPDLSGRPSSSAGIGGPTPTSGTGGMVGSGSSAASGSTIARRTSVSRSTDSRSRSAGPLRRTAGQSGSSGSSGSSASGSSRASSTTAATLARFAAAGGAAPMVAPIHAPGTAAPTTAGPAGPAGQTGQAGNDKSLRQSATERLDHLDEIVAMVEARVLAELERRGGRHRAWM